MDFSKSLDYKYQQFYKLVLYSKFSEGQNFKPDKITIESGH